jgi:hypothetical protein
MKYDNQSLDGRVVFIDKGHKYTLLDNPKLKIVSVTTQLKNYHEPFDSERISKESSEKVGSPYFGMDPADIREMWSKKANKASSEGTLLHSYGEDILNGREAIMPKLPKAKWVSKAIDDILNKFNYTLAKTELLVYSEILQLAGQSDMILKKKWLEEDEDYSYAVYDWKFLSKDIEKKSFYNPATRKYKKMFHPFHHLLDCNWIHYSIQLAIYQTMTGDPGKIKEKVLVVVYDDRYEFVPCYPMRVFWDTNNTLHAVYETFNGKVYDSRVDKILDKWPSDITGR